METWIDRERVFAGKIFDVEQGRVRLDDGQEATRDVVAHPGGVTIVPFHEGHVTLVRQYRVAIAREILEAPAGKLEGDEDPEARGRIELEEEAGLRAGRMVSVGAFYPSPGFLTEKLYVYLALDLEEVPPRPEWDEVIEIVRMPLDEARRMLADNAFEDAKTIIGLHALLTYLKD